MAAPGSTCVHSQAGLVTGPSVVTKCQRRAPRQGWLSPQPAPQQHQQQARRHAQRVACVRRLVPARAGGASQPISHAGDEPVQAASGGASASALPQFDSIPDALDAIARGEIVVVLDDEDRENEGDLIMAADRATAAAIHFIIDYSSGVVCVGMEGQDLDRLDVPLMVSSRENDESMYTAFTVTVDLREGTSTGISAGDRAATIRALAEPSALPNDFRRPGHIFPLRARPGGVLARPGHTEASVDLARLAGCAPAGVMCEVVNKEDGSMSRTPELLEFSARNGLKCVTIADLIRHRLATEQLLERLPPSSHLGALPAVAASSSGVPVEVVQACGGPMGGWAEAMLLKGRPTAAGAAGVNEDGTGNMPRLVAVMREQVLGHVFGASAAGCAAGGAGNPEAVLDLVAQQGGLLVYLRPGGDSRGGQRQQLPEHVAKALQRAPGGAERAAELALVASLLRDEGVDTVTLLDPLPGDAEALEQLWGIRVAGSTTTAAASSGSSGDGNGGGVVGLANGAKAVANGSRSASPSSNGLAAVQGAA